MLLTPSTLSCSHVQPLVPTHLDRNDVVATDFEKVLGVEADDTGLVGLGDVGEDRVDHADDHAILVRMAGVLDDGNDVRAFLGDVEEVSARAVRELDCVDNALLRNGFRCYKKKGRTR